MANVQLNLAVIRTQDMDRAAVFYALLGLTFQKHRHSSGPEHYASEEGGVVFEIYPSPGPGDGSTVGTRLGFRVPSMDTVVAALEGAGAQIISPPKDSPWGRRAVVTDPDGRRVELTQPQ